MIEERHLAQAGLSNYWGLQPRCAIRSRSTLGPGGTDELAACVAALHSAGIEVILDVVFNHTGEGDALGPTVSLRGLDNATYYRTVAGDSARYVDDTGCGNVPALDRPAVLRLAMDVLLLLRGGRGCRRVSFRSRDHARAPRRRVRSRGATSAGNNAGSPAARPEADRGAMGHWDGAAIASVRSRRNGEMERSISRHDAAVLARRYRAGSASLQRVAGLRRPLRAALAPAIAIGQFRHCTRRLHACRPCGVRDEATNEANGESNRDGSNENLSWNRGVEGPTSEIAINAARRRGILQPSLATLLLARGAPMLAMGDELGRTQPGNNSAYARDNALTWVDWTTADTALIAFRRAADRAAQGTARVTRRSLARRRASDRAAFRTSSGAIRMGER